MGWYIAAVIVAVDLTNSVLLRVSFEHCMSTATLFCNRGKAFRALKRYAEARADFDEALKREPGHKHAIAELSSLAAVDGGANRSNATSGPPKTTSAPGEMPGDGRALEDWSVEDVTRWFKTKFAFSYKYQILWEEQCISGALLPYLTETELKDDVDMKSSIHRNGALRAIILAVSRWHSTPFDCTSCLRCCRVQLSSEALHPL